MERANGHLGKSFLPERTFTSPADFNTQLTEWLTVVANPRKHASTGMFPVEALTVDRCTMAPLPPVAPSTGTTVPTRLGRGYYVSVGGNACSVHPEAIGRMITVTAGLERIAARCGDRVVADHERLWGTAGLTSNPEHVRAAAILREHFRNRPTAGAHLEIGVGVADLGGAYAAAFGTGEVA